MKYIYLYAFISAFFLTTTVYPSDNTGVISTLGSGIQGLENHAPWVAGVACLGLAAVDGYTAAQEYGLVHQPMRNNADPSSWQIYVKALMVPTMFKVGGNHFSALLQNASALSGAGQAIQNKEFPKFLGETGQWVWNNAPHIVPLLFAVQASRAVSDWYYTNPKGRVPRLPLDSAGKATWRTLEWLAAARMFVGA